ncbi:MAG: response regulator [bacterium]
MNIQDLSTEKNITIMIVEDSHTQAVYLKKILIEKNYTVTVTHNGEEALAELRKKMPKIVVSDVLMPEMNGYELCKKIKSDENLKKIPVILLTTLSDPEDIIKGLKVGADHFITKPFKPDFLISHIQYILINHDLRKKGVADLGMEIYFGGQKYFLTSNRIQILDLLFSTYEAVIHKNKELEQLNRKLEESLRTIKQLKGLIPICSECKKIRNDKGYWEQLEVFLKAHSDIDFTHGLCPECEKKYYNTMKKN